MDKDSNVEEKKKRRKKKNGQNHENTSFYAAISPASYKICQLVNINSGNINNEEPASSISGGLVFKYIDKEDGRVSAKGKSIFLNNYGYCLEDIPVIDGEPQLSLPPSPVTVREVDSGSLPLEYLIRIRQMNMMFTELTFSQIFALDKFIRENINGKRFSAIHLTVELQ